MKQEAKYWFLLSFMVQQPGMWVPSSFLLASDSRDLTIPQINNAKLLNSIPGSSVLMGVSLVAHNTERGINGLPDVEAPSVISSAYAMGMTAAMNSNPADPAQPTNPFLKPMPDDHEKADMAEWTRGFSTVRGIQQQGNDPIVPTQPEPPKPSVHASAVVTPKSLGKPGK